MPEGQGARPSIQGGTIIDVRLDSHNGTRQGKTGRRTGLFITETRYPLPGNVMIQVALGLYVSAIHSIHGTIIAGGRGHDRDDD